MKSGHQGKIALVTGGGSGIGRASALAFSREGAKIIVSDVNRRGGEETAARIREGGGEALFLETDVSKSGEVENLVRKAVEVYGRIDCAHNNAGIMGLLAPTAEYSEEAWDEVIRINLKGIWLCLKFELLQMLGQGGGSIVNTSSTLGLGGTKNMPAYVASKHGVAGLTRAAAMEYAQWGIRVNAVCPGFIRTPMVDLMIREEPQIEPQLAARYPLGRIGNPEEVAEAVVWLCSEAASFVTGHTLVIDGGRTAG